MMKIGKVKKAQLDIILNINLIYFLIRQPPASHMRKYLKGGYNRKVESRFAGSNREAINETCIRQKSAKFEIQVLVSVDPSR